MQNDIVRQPPPQNQEPQAVVAEPPAPEQAQDVGEASPAEAIAPQEQEIAPEVLQPTKSSGAPVGVIIVALIICVALCSAVIYAALQPQN